MLRETLIKIYERDLDHLSAEIEAYKNETDLWTTQVDITNSAGNLCLHLYGNLRHFIGAVLGGTGYVRDRDAEFSSKNVSKADLLTEIRVTRSAVSETLANLTDSDLAATYPIEVFGEPMTTAYFLVHLTTHFNYHLGQINYHRRLLAEK